MVTEFALLLDAGDVDALRVAWAQVAPHMPQPESREAAEIAMHMARTSALSVAFPKRAWSHRWLTERALPSQLPDELRPKAERLYPVSIEAVGISVKYRDPLLKPAGDAIRRAMETAVEECFAEGRREPGYVKARMMEARSREKKALFGRIPETSTYG